MKYLINTANDRLVFETKAYDKVAVTVNYGNTYRWRIFIQKQLERELITWYHEYLMYPGAFYMGDSLRKNYRWPNMMKKNRV